MGTMLKQRDEEWKERALMQRLDSKINTFYNKQLKRDEDVLTFLEKRGKDGIQHAEKGRRVQISLQRTAQGILKDHGEERQGARDG